MIHELASTRILPAMRGILAHRLSGRGVSQRKISWFLEVTQPMISKILKKPIDEYYEELEKLGLPRELIDHYVNILLDTSANSKYERFIVVSYTIINQMALRALCNTRNYLSRICFSGEFRDPEVEYYKSVLFKILSIRGLEKIIPEVGSNLVYAPEKPTNIGDIIGLTGRIVKVYEGVTYYGEPVYGGSRHVAKILLYASKYNPKIRFCFNIVCNSRVKSALLRIEAKTIVTGPHMSEEEFWTGIEKAAEESPNIICDQGGLGLEPNTYILAEDYSRLEYYLKRIMSELT